MMPGGALRSGRRHCIGTRRRRSSPCVGDARARAGQRDPAGDRAGITDQRRTTNQVDSRRGADNRAAHGVRDGTTVFEPNGDAAVKVVLAAIVEQATGALTVMSPAPPPSATESSDQSPERSVDDAAAGSKICAGISRVGGAAGQAVPRCRACSAPARRSSHQYHWREVPPGRLMTLHPNRLVRRRRQQQLTPAMLTVP